MTQLTAYHQLGQLIVAFQHAEAALTHLLVLLAGADEEKVRILVNELEYSQRVKTTDVLFAYFVDLMRNPDQMVKADFHELMVELGKLGERRNEIVHSKYANWRNVHGEAGLLRENSKLRAGKGIREEEEEELLPEAFLPDFERLTVALKALERFRLKIIEWL